MIEVCDLPGTGMYKPAVVAELYGRVEVIDGAEQWWTVSLLDGDTLVFGINAPFCVPDWSLADLDSRGFRLLHRTEVNKERILRGWVQWVDERTSHQVLDTTND